MKGRAAAGRYWEAGQCGKRVWIADDWKVLDVGSGAYPHPRANVILDRDPDDNRHRAGAALVRDARLVVGDALALPFEDATFDYVIASHVAEHVDDPTTLCKELSRVARAGYIETPGWLGDQLWREDFHLWRVRVRHGRLVFRWVQGEKGIRVISPVVYALTYFGEARPGHPVPVLGGFLGRLVRGVRAKILQRMFNLPAISDVLYTRYEWEGHIDMVVEGDGAAADSSPSGR